MELVRFLAARDNIMRRAALDGARNSQYSDDLQWHIRFVCRSSQIAARTHNSLAQLCVMYAPFAPPELYEETLRIAMRHQRSAASFYDDAWADLSLIIGSEEYRRELRAEKVEADREET